MLFLAEIQTRSSTYNDDDGNIVKDSPVFYRLVEAADAKEAEKKATAAFTREDTYGTSVEAEVTIHQTLV